eukprot:33417-Lingulodinium_polyedra.AAC.1
MAAVARGQLLQQVARRPRPAGQMAHAGSRTHERCSCVVYTACVTHLWSLCNGVQLCVNRDS